MTFPTGAPDGPGYEPDLARLRDYWLGGSHHSERDRAAADRILVVAPQLPYLVRQKRLMQQRMVRYLIKHGVRQFLNFDAGVPTRGHIHEVAQPLLPDARVVYADTDPLIAQIGQNLLEGDKHTAYLHADVRCTGHVLNHPDLRRLINLGEPVAIMMLDTLLHVPDRDDPATLITPYTTAACPGSYLALSQFSQTQHMIDGLTLFTQLYGEPPAIPFREPQQLAHLFTDLDIVEPGIVPVPLWHPDPGEDTTPNPERIRVYAGLGRKP
jgi:S-adenosyl methyltransferase